MKFCVDMRGSPRMNPTDFDDPLMEVLIVVPERIVPTIIKCIGPLSFALKNLSNIGFNLRFSH